MPTFKWHFGSREIMAGGRFKIITVGEDNTVILVVGKAKTNDDGIYTITAENEHGQDTVNVRMYVTAGEMDFRNMLKHK